MDTAVKQKWVDALRSGKYKQAKGTLRRSEKNFCCLGVLCEVVGAEWRRYDYNDWDAVYNGRRANAVIPMDLRDDVGLTQCNPDVTITDSDGDIEYTTLASLNDRGESFEFIADIIEAQL